MSNRRTYSETTLEIMKRFFEAMEAVKANKRLKSINSYCQVIGVDRSNYYRQRRDLGRGFFEVGWIVPLIKDYGVSSAWLLTGVGSMFNA